MNKTVSKGTIHIGFHIGLVLKGLFDAGEIISGFLMFFLTPDRMNQLIAVISKEELFEDPTDLIMNYLISVSQVYSLSAQHFTTYYLLSHGGVKLIILILLWQKKLWAYPVSCLMFLVFIIFQMQRFMSTYSFVLLFLSFLDGLMIVLTILEYKNIRNIKNEPSD